MISSESLRVGAVGLCFLALSGCPSTPQGGSDAGGDVQDSGTGGTDGSAVDGGGGLPDGHVDVDAGGLDAGGGGDDAGSGGDDAGSATDGGACEVSPTCLSACESARVTCDGCVGSCTTTCDTTRTSCRSSCTSTASACRTGCGSLATCRTGCNALPAGPSRDACLSACDSCLPNCSATETSCNAGCDGTHTSCVASCGGSCAGGGSGSCAAAASACTAACPRVGCGGVDAAVAVPDASVHFTFASPAQIDLSSVLVHDTVASSVAGGSSFPPLTSMDGSHFVMMTATFGGSFGGLPDDGRYPADANHPAAQLAWRDSSFAPNSVILNAPTLGLTEVTFPVVPTQYTHLQLYFVSTEGASAVQVDLHYADGTATASFTAPDWFNTPSAPVFRVQGNLGRWDGSMRSRNGSGAQLMGTDITIDGARTLATVTVRATGPGWLVLYGATAY